MSEPQRDQNDAQNAFNVAFVMLHVLALPLEVIWHHRFGKRYLGLSVFGSFFSMVVFAQYNLRHGSPGPLILFGYGFVLLWFVRWLEAHTHRHLVHSLYTGWPWICNAPKPPTEEEAKGFFIPFLSFLIGFVVMSVNVPLGMYLMVCAAAMALKYRILSYAQQQRDQDQDDAIINAQFEAERFRERQKRFRNPR